MKTLLQLKSSIFSDAGQSSALAGEFVARWQVRNPGAKVIVRDLARDEIPHLDAGRFQSFLTKPAERTPEQRAVATFSDQLIGELKRADVIVLGVPMYNFGIPSTLKAYIDHIARAGETFRYTEKGPVGLLRGKSAYVFTTRGGLYAGTPRDTQTTYIRDILGFIGIDEVEFVYAEGLAIDAQRKAAAIEDARRAIQRLLDPAQALAA